MNREERQKRDDKIIALYKEHQFSLKEIGEKFGMTKQGVSLILKKNDIEMEYPRDRILAYCKSHKREEINIVDLAERFNTTPTVISSVLTSNKVAHSRSVDSRQKRIQSIVRRLKSMDTSDKSVADLMDIFSQDNYPSVTTMIRILKENNIPYNKRHYQYRDN